MSRFQNLLVTKAWLASAFYSAFYLLISFCTVQLYISAIAPVTFTWIFPLDFLIQETVVQMNIFQRDQQNSP